MPTFHENNKTTLHVVILHSKHIDFHKRFMKQQKIDKKHTS